MRKKYFGGLVAALMLASCLSVSALAAGETLTFQDVPETHWANRYVMACVEHGAIEGTTAAVDGVGTFSPNGKVTLGQFLAVLTRLVAAEEIGSGSDGHWALPYYEAALAAGLVLEDEYAGTSEALNRSLTREEMAVLTVRAAAVMGETLTVLEGIENNMNDFADITPDRAEAVKQAYSNGLLTGKNGGRFDPKGTMTRAEMATVVCRLMNYYPREEVVVKEPEEEGAWGDYVVTEAGYTTGMLRPAVSREYELKALGAAQVGEDANGVYVILTAPQLPSVIADDFTFNLSADVYKSNGDYFADSIWTELKPGESTQKIYFNSFKFTKVTKSEIGSMAIGVYIYANGDVSRHMFTRSIYSDYPTMANATKYSGSYDYVEFDSSAVWAGLGL